MNREVYKHIFAELKTRPLYWLSFLLELLRTVFGRVVVVIFVAKIAEHLTNGDFASAQTYIFYFLGLSVAAVFAGGGGALIGFWSENNAYHKMAIRFYKRLTAKDMAFYRDHQTGYLAGLFRQYLDGVLMLTRMIRVEAVRIFVTFSAPIIVLWYANWKLGLVMLLVVIVQAIYIAWASALTNKYRMRSHETHREIAGEVSDSITNIAAFKSGGSSRSISKIARLISREVELFWVRRKMNVLLDLPRDIITSLGVAASIYIVTSVGPSNSEAVSLVVLTLMYMFQLSRNVNRLPQLVMDHDELITKLYPILPYLRDTHEAIVDPKDPKELNVTKGAIDITNVTFSYAESGGDTTYPVFSNLDIHIPGGQRVGVVGLSGAGKSTLTSLLMRFDDVDSGAIKIDGIDIREVRQADLRENISYVPQEPLLFHRSIRENITYFKPDATDEEVFRAAKAAHAHDFIEKLASGYDSLVGERGIKLSGGQKQRIVIARAILKGAPIMLFDEATSALDSESERIIQNALPEILGDCTAIIIAHRLSTIAGLDRILVMHDGKIEEDGTHEELLAKKGRYWRLWEKQAHK